MAASPEHSRPVGSAAESRGRTWLKRGVAVALPFAVVALLEIALRVSGLCKPDPWANPFVTFEEVPTFFPNWDTEVRMPKPTGTSRVFALGGSNTWGFGVSEPYPKRLERRLANRPPGRRWEVINGGIAAYGSHRVYEVMKRACQFDPDLIVAYMGNNEFLEEVFYASDGLVAKINRLARFANGLRTVRCLRKLMPELLSRGKVKLQRHYLGQSKFPLIRSEQQYRTRLRFLSSNVRQMIGYCKTQGVDVVFVPAAPNLLWPPGDPAHGPGYSSNARKWDARFASVQSQVRAALYHRGQSRSDSSGLRPIVEACHELHQIDDRYAMSHYYLGLAWLAAGDREKGWNALVLANLHDKRGDRSNVNVIETIISTCREQGARVLDLRNRFFLAMPEEFDHALRHAYRTRLFLDFCHLSADGHALVADALVEFLAKESSLPSPGVP